MIACGSPAAITASHSARPYVPATLTSNASSPEKLTRHTRAGMPAASVSRIAMNGKPSRLTSRPGASAPTTSRERGPTIATVAHCSVTEVSRTRSSGHSVCSHSSSQSSTAAALPVVVVARKRSSASRIDTPSSSTIPSAPHSSPYLHAPTASLEKSPVYMRLRNSTASGPWTSILPSVVASITATPSRAAAHSRSTAASMSSPSRG